MNKSIILWINVSKTAGWVANSVNLDQMMHSEAFYLGRHFAKAYLFEYSRTSLSLTRLFRITAYLEVKIWSLF